MGACSSPLLAPFFEIETTHYFSMLPTATPYSRNSLFSGLFPSEIAARFPDWWGEREDESLNAHERELLEAHLAELKRPIPVRYEKISSVRTVTSSSATSRAASRAKG